MESIEAKISRNVLKLLAPPPDLKVSEWADKERRLSSEASAEPGKWDTSRAPYQRGMLDAINEPGIFKVVIMSSAQVGKTELDLNIIGYFIHQDPSPMLLVQPTLDLAEAFSKDRLAPMIRDTPALHGKVQDARSRDSGNTLLHKTFPGGHITMAGANSPASLASRPVRIVILDETDRYPHSAGAEGDPVKLAQKRATTFFNKILIENATPTIEGASRIAQSFEESDKRYFYVPCPLCNKKQVLKWPQFRFDKELVGDKVAAINVRYVCEFCEGEFNDSHKHRMLRQGEWIPTSTSRGVAGFHIWEGYSPWVKWEQIANEFLEASKSAESLKVWVNTSLGETWKEKGEAPDWKRLYDRRELYERNKVPEQVVFLTCGADVQANRIEAEIVGWAKDKQSWSIDYRILEGDTSKDEVWDKLTEVLYEVWPHSTGLNMQIRMLALDTGFNTQKAYNWARTHQAKRVMATKGTDGAAVMLDRPRLVDINLKGKKVKRGVNLWMIGVSIAKSELYGWLRLEKPLDNEPFQHGYCHFPEYGDDFFKQLTAESLQARVVKGRKRYEWVKIYERNEALDCRVLNRVAAARIGIDIMTEHQWQMLQSRMGQTFPTKSSPDPNAPAAPATPKKKRDSSFWD